MKSANRIPAGSVIACVLTGHGLKDPDWAIAGAPRPQLVPAKIESILEHLDLT
jgi:threonine synthase